MKVTQWYLWAVAAALALMVAGCSGSSTKTPAPTPPTPTSVTLPGDNTLVAGELTVAAGQSKTRGGVVFSCAADGDDCVITIVDDLGLLVASATGGDVTATAEPKPPEPMVYDLGLPAGHSLGMGTITVKAGETVSVAGGVDITCPAGGEDCMIAVSKDLGVVSATSTGGQATTALTPMNVDLPPGSGELVATTFTVSAGGSVDEKGVKFACSGDLACVVTVAADGSATSTGGTVKATQIPPFGHVVTTDLGKKVREGDLLAVEHRLPVDANGDAKDGEPAGITLSSTTHEADTGAPRTAGINDMTVDVKHKETDLPADPVSIYTGGAEAHTSHDPSLVVERTVSFTTTGNWVDDENEADEWSVKSKAFDATGANTVWGHSEALVEDEVGGRTVYLDIYSDFNNKKEKLVTEATDGVDGELSTGTTAKPGLKVMWEDLKYKDKAEKEFKVKTWTFGNPNTKLAINETSIPAGVIRFDDPKYVSPNDLEFGEKQELKPEEQNKEPTDTIMGTWKGIPGSYSCAKADEGNGNCFIRNQQGGVTAGGKFRFRPDPEAMVVDRDTDWLAVGVWMTVPDDSTGDYAVGAFVHGSHGKTRSEIKDVTGTADYKGEAVGRFAETANNRLKTSGRFSAVAELTADFDDDVVSGALKGFSVTPVMSDDSLASGSTDNKPNWAISLQSATMSDKGPTYDGEISGHAHGHALDGFWAGQFFGLTEKRVQTGDKDTDNNDIFLPQVPPSAIAGTFAASDRDPDDVYSLSLIGAFGAEYYQKPVVSTPTE